jgi:hypothetical protein
MLRTIKLTAMLARVLSVMALVFLAPLLTPRLASAADEQWQVGTAPTFSSGRYGSTTNTEVLYTPITTRRLFADGDLTVVFPWMCVRGSGGVVVVSGTPVVTNPLGTGSTRGAPTEPTTRGNTGRSGDGSDTTRPTADAPVPAGTSVRVPAVNACGLGDVVVRGRYYLLDGATWRPTIAVRAHVKTPTANVKRGLGTGRTDEGMGIEVSQGLPGGVALMGDAGYTVIGKTTDMDLRNTWWYDVGVSQDLAGGVLNLSVFFEEYRALVPDEANARDVLAAVSVKAAGGWRFQASAQFGVSEGAPDRGLTFGLSRRF